MRFRQFHQGILSRFLLIQRGQPYKLKALSLAFLLSCLLFLLLPFCDFIFLKFLKPFLGNSPYLRMGLFPCLSLLLSLSLKPKWDWKFPQLKFLFFSTPLPVLLSYLFGQWSHWPESAHPVFLNYYWYVFCIPLGEELLFRGWTFEIFERLFPDVKFSLLLPLPLSAWMTSLLFALWHLQNLQDNPTLLVLFQVVYTFFTGLWLVEMRIRCKNPLPGCLAHSLLNLAATLP